jgi:hypothetical protein
LVGKLDELRVWNYARSEQQIRENMHLTLSGSESGLLNYWQFNEGSGTTAHDYTGNCSGTLHNLANGNWVNSSIPLGGGVSNSQTVNTTGNVAFTSTGLSSNFTAISATENITVSRINLSPNTKPSDPFYAACSQYWVVKNFDNQTFSADLTFTLADDFNSYNGYNPGSVRLFTRPATSDGAWTFVENAASVDTVANSATFTNLSAFGQFLVLRTYPENYAGNALEFDGVDDYVELSDASGFQYNGSFTVEAWVKTEVMGTGFHSIAAKGTEWELKMYEGSSFIIIEFGVNSNAIFSFKNLNTSLVVGKWLHLCGVVNQTAGQKHLMLYVNGEAGSSVTPPAITPTASLIKIGSGFKGKIDEVRIWREARTQQQIREKMHLTPTSADKNLDVCLQFNEPYGTTANDVAGGNLGTLTNMSIGCWVLSGVPAGGGVSNTQTETGGTLNFTGTGLSMFFNSHASASITVSRIDVAPNINPSLFDSQYWIINLFGTGTFNANLSFTVAEDLTTDDQASSSGIKLYSRPTTDDSNWIYGLNASSVDAAGNTATFNNLTAFSQLAVCRRLAADNFSGNALSFNHGHQDYISATGLKSSMIQFTIEAWVYHNNLSEGIQQYITLGPNAAGIKYNGQSAGGDTWLNFFINTNNYSGYAVTAVNVLSTETWMHVAGSYDGATLNLYLNGELVKTMAASARIDTLDGTFYISTTDAMDGKMDEIRIWNYARNITDIRADMYRTLSGTETGLVSYWQFNEGSGTAPKDIVGGNPGTFHNMDATNWILSTIPTPYQSIADGNWSSSSTWDLGQDVPVKDWSRVQIKSDVILDTDKTMTDLTVDAAASFVIASTSQLTVTGNLLNNAGTGGLVLQSDATGTASLLHTTSNVNAAIQRYITGNPSLTAKTYHFVSVPLTPATNSTSNLFLGAYLYDFDVAGNTWHGLGTSTTTVLDETKGYMIYTPENNHTYTFNGPMNAGTFSPLVIFTGAGNNLVPNTYPSAIDWDAGGWTKTGIANSVYFWPSGGTEYITYVDGVVVPGGTPNPGIIPAGQSFIVKATASPTFKMTDAVRVHSVKPFLKSDENTADLLRIKATANEMTDEAVVRFKAVATLYADPDFDAWKLYGTDGAPQLYTLANDNEMLAINSLPYPETILTIPLNFEMNAEATVTLTFNNIGSFDPSLSILLNDELTGQNINLRNNPVYTFNHKPENDPNRFKIVFGGATDVNEISGDGEGIEIYSYDHQVFIKSEKMEIMQVSVYSILGQNLVTRNLSGFQNLTGLPIQIDFTGNPGFYLVKVKTENGIKSEKIFIR